jgi:hypothetical protein
LILDLTVGFSGGIGFNSVFGRLVAWILDGCWFLLDIEPFRYQSTSDTKVVRLHIVNNGIIALFYAYGIYCNLRNLTVPGAGK